MCKFTDELQVRILWQAKVWGFEAVCRVVGMAQKEGEPRPESQERAAAW